VRRNALAFVVAVLFALPAAAQHIIGTDFVGGFVQLVNLDPVSGVCSLIGSATDATSLLGSGTAYDATNDFYYFFGNNGTNDRIYRVHTGSGTSSSAAISGVTASNLRDIEWSGSALLALISVGSAMQLASVNTSTGVITPIGSTFSGGATIPWSGLNRLDPSTNRWFFLSNTTMERVSTVTNDIDASAAAPAPPRVGLQAGGGNLFMLQFNGAQLRLLKLDTSGFTATTTGADLGALSSSGKETLDPAGSRYYFVSGTSLYAIDTSSLTLIVAAGYPVTLTGTGTALQNLELDAGTLPVALQRLRAD
jgi:hypothetical protein